MKKLFVLILLGCTCLAFTSILYTAPKDQPVPIPASPQRTGNKDKGYEYLTTGDYIKSGIPYSYFLLGFGKTTSNALKRDSPNHLLSHEYTAVKAPNGETVVAPNCLQCHAQVFEGQLYVGMGNTFIDFTDRQKLSAGNARMAEGILKKGDPKRYEAAGPFLQSMKVLGNQLYTQVRGVNSADRLADILVAHRDPATLRWSDTPVIDVQGDVIPTDTPPWWLLKKKNAMFYNGFGRGDFGRFLMASNLLTVSDSSEAREVDSHFNDVLAYIYSLEPPKYPGAIDRNLAKQGGVVFVENCSKCHGHYGEGSEDYPNLLIPESLVKTDSLLYKSNYQTPQFIDWFNKSWFAMGDHPARLEAFNGYIAPPLDGIWVTAPYLHNGSIPTLEALLDSKKRPTYWSRDFTNPQYDYVKIGWQYMDEPSAKGTTAYNTTLPGYGNYGHTFGDKLTAKDRKALIEYLKTL